jgi:hypothetical protein
LSLKIGVAGNVLLGPAGNAGNFTVPVRMAIFRKSDNEPEVTKLYQTTVNVGQSEPQASFTIVSEPLLALPKKREKRYARAQKPLWQVSNDTGTSQPARNH